jgi:hypothetical protein
MNKKLIFEASFNSRDSAEQCAEGLPDIWGETIVQGVFGAFKVTAIESDEAFHKRVKKEMKKKKI